MPKPKITKSAKPKVTKSAKSKAAKSAPFEISLRNLSKAERGAVKQLQDLFQQFGDKHAELVAALGYDAHKRAANLGAYMDALENLNNLITQNISGLTGDLRKFYRRQYGYLKKKMTVTLKDIGNSEIYQRWMATTKAFKGEISSNLGKVLMTGGDEAKELIPALLTNMAAGAMIGGALGYLGGDWKSGALYGGLTGGFVLVCWRKVWAT